MKQNAVILNVSKEKEGCFATFGEAVKAAEAMEATHVTIQLDKGIYKEKVTIKKNNLTLLGISPEETIITFDDYGLEILEDGEKRGTFRTPTLFIDASDFTAKNITFENSAGPGKKVGQALALYVDGDRMIFENCRLLGGQDTLFTAPLPPKAYEKNGFRGPKEFAPRTHGRHLYKDCFICGDVDFIFGGATAYFENCEIFSNNLGQEVNGYVTAASTLEDVPGYVFYQCRFTSDCAPKSVYLGRPWRNYAKVAILNSEIGEHIKEEGWHDWDKPDARETVIFAEYNNFGAGADTKARPSWVKILTKEEADAYTKEKILGDWYI
ncbi:pectinesterase [Anaerocolumna cellulosilytica]|uniref:Pectinesterase n=1 Tax=Anaerocolumna cellulosilytica TaxID=433286 RepID=A0A6S6R2V8_9FIRM|nr:pectinesterase family protein [Anaerocolumna cellulosilytica]MBB5196047.1 pectinesterase [Anaerocolumna cellulosilytica]BCJ93650.1 pectinesterase [Anaerocolumna cellulosilytica]